MIDTNSPVCNDHERRISLTEQAIAQMTRTNEGITAKLDLILAQITKVAILEERHNAQASDLGRAHDKISKLTREYEEFSREVRSFINEARGMAKATKVIWMLLGSGVALALGKILFLSGALP